MYDFICFMCKKAVPSTMSCEFCGQVYCTDCYFNHQTTTTHSTKQPDGLIVGSPPIQSCSFSHLRTPPLKETICGVPPVDATNPQHYRMFPTEVIEITEHLNFNMGNAVKYITRTDYKGQPMEDLKKALWYIDREIKRRESE